MLKYRKALGVFLATGAMLAALSACQQQEGPAERAGSGAADVICPAGSDASAAISLADIT